MGRFRLTDENDNLSIFMDNDENNSKAAFKRLFD